MSEGEVPEIPKHLVESMPSAGKYEQDLRREYQIRTLARECKIPQASLENPTVRRFLTVWRDAARAERREVHPDPNRGGSVYRGLPDPYSLYASARAILEDGIGANFNGSAALNPIQEWTDAAGMKLELAIPYEQRGYLNRPEPTGLWTGGADEPWPRKQARTTGRLPDPWWETQDDPLERTDREHLAAIDAEAERLGQPPDKWSVDDVHDVLSRLVYARQLVEETSALEELPSTPGLFPSAVDRLRAVAPLLRLAAAKLEEPFAGGKRLVPDEVVEQLRPVAAAIDWKIVPDDGGSTS